MISDKSIAQGIYEETQVETGFFILKFTNDSTENQYFKREVNSNFIQFHFCVKGQGAFVFNEGSYNLPILEDHALLPW